MKDRGTDLFSRVRSGQNISQSKESILGENKSGRLEGNELQVCPCGWQKVTSVRCYKMHQGSVRNVGAGEGRTQMQNIQNKKVYSKQHKARTKGAAEPVIKNT